MVAVADAINPQHYQGFSNGAQPIDIAEHVGFNLGNTISSIAPGQDAKTTAYKTSTKPSTTSNAKYNEKKANNDHTTTPILAPHEQSR